MSPRGPIVAADDDPDNRRSNDRTLVVKDWQKRTLGVLSGFATELVRVE